MRGEKAERKVGNGNHNDDLTRDKALPLINRRVASVVVFPFSSVSSLQDCQPPTPLHTKKKKQPPAVIMKYAYSNMKKSGNQSSSRVEIRVKRGWSSDSVAVADSLSDSDSQFCAACPFVWLSTGTTRCGNCCAPAAQLI